MTKNRGGNDGSEKWTEKTLRQRGLVHWQILCATEVKSIKFHEWPQLWQIGVKEILRLADVHLFCYRKKIHILQKFTPQRVWLFTISVLAHKKNYALSGPWLSLLTATTLKSRAVFFLSRNNENLLFNSESWASPCCYYCFVINHNSGRFGEFQQHKLHEGSTFRKIRSIHRNMVDTQTNTESYMV